MKKILRHIDAWLAASEAYANSKSFDSGVLMTARLAPDQFPLSKQVQIACDTAKLAASRLTGKEAPVHSDTETTVAELRTRIDSVIDYLTGFQASDFVHANTRTVTQPRWEGKNMTGHDYFVEHVVPNFYFHSVHVYAILRHNGVSVGKKDYLGQLSFR